MANLRIVIWALTVTVRILIRETGYLTVEVAGVRHNRGSGDAKKKQQGKECGGLQQLTTPREHISARALQWESAPEMLHFSPVRAILII